MKRSNVSASTPRVEAPVLEVRDLEVEFRLRAKKVQAVNGLSYSLERGETLAILGESGSGKSVAAFAVVGALTGTAAKITGGQILFEGRDMLALPERERRRIRGRRISIIFQDSLSALNPLFTVGNQIGEMFRVHAGLPRRAAHAAAIELLERVGIPDPKRRSSSYPHEFSGGMRQRVVIAMALALKPDVLIADEPTTALDVTVQAQIMELLKQLQEEMGMGVVLITHDLGVVADIADRIIVMYAGRAIEESPVHELYRRPMHPYTLGLMGSIPRLDRTEETLRPIPGSPPDMSRLPSGCPFHPRCSYVQRECRTVAPLLRQIDGCRSSACHFAEEIRESPVRG